MKEEVEEEKQQMSDPYMKGKKLMEMEKELLSTAKRPKQVVCDRCGKPRRERAIADVFNDKRERAIADVFNDDSEANSCVMNRVQEVRANLDSQFPNFVKLMIRSNVTVGFLLNFPRKFCEMYMPRYDATVVLVDGSEGGAYQAKYLFGKNSLSAGWRSFSNAHRLNVGDALVFQLIKHCTFKVYVIRTNELDEVDGAIALLHLKADTTSSCENHIGTRYKDKEKHLKPLPSDNVEEHIQKIF